MSLSDSTQTDRLLAALERGDQSALEEIIERYTPFLHRIIQIRMSPELNARIDPSDVVQETQMVVVNRLNEFVRKRPASFRVWLRSRAIEQLIDQHRRHVGAVKRSVRRERNYQDVSSIAIARTLLSATPSRAVQQRELTELVRDLVDELNSLDREMLTLRHAEGLSNAEAAEALGINIETARKRYGRALRRLAERAAAAGLDAELSWSR